MKDPVFTNCYPGEARVTITAVGGKERASKVTLKAFGRGSTREGVTKKQRQFQVVSGTYPLKKKVIHRDKLTQSEFELEVKKAAESLATEFHSQVWDEGDGWGFASEEREPFNDPIPF